MTDHRCQVPMPTEAVQHCRMWCATFEVNIKVPSL